MDKNILIYSNRENIVEIVKPFFLDESIKLRGVFNLEELLEITAKEDIHLIMVNMELNTANWSEETEILQYIKKGTTVPVIVISKQATEIGEIIALEYGADDYVTLNSTPLVLLARIKSHIRKNLIHSRDSIYRVGELEINDRSRTVSVKGKIINLTPIEYKILRLLMKEQGNVLSNNQIYESIWQTEAIGADNTIPVHIRHIRKKIEANPNKPCYLKVVWGLGYKVG